MKKTICAIAIGLFIYSIPLFSQTEQGKILVGISSGLGLNGGQTGFSFSNTKFKSDDFESDGANSFSFNLAPRLGYFATNDLAVGLEINYSYLSFENQGFDGLGSSKTKVNQYSAGPFIRYYFKGEKVRPIVEGGVSFGRSNNTNEGANPVDGSDLEFSSNLFAFGAGAGLAVTLGDKVSFDVLLVYLNSQVKPTENNNNNSRSISSSFGLRLGFSIYLGQSSNPDKITP
ncbi:MAG: outer membrane beta-barrel protein [Bacteroidota bacterium]